MTSLKVHVVRLDKYLERRVEHLIGAGRKMHPGQAQAFSEAW